MRPLSSYDYRAIARNKAREAACHARHVLLLIRHAGCVARDGVNAVAALALLVLLVIVLGVARLLAPRAYAAFMRDEHFISRALFRR